MRRRGRVVTFMRGVARRHPWAGVAVGVALIAVCAGSLVAVRRLSASSDSGAPTPGHSPATAGLSGTTAMQQPGPGDLPGASASPSGFAQASASGTGDRTVVVFGLFTNDRMVAVSMDNLAVALAHPDAGAFPANAVSPTTGSAVATARIGDAVVVAASDQAQLVRLTRDFKQRDTLSVSDRLGSGDLPLFYGSVVPIGGGDADVTVAFHDKIGVLRVNVPSWRVVASKVYDDRFAGAPQGCLGPSRQLVVVSTGYVDYLDPLTLDRVRSTPIDGTPIGAACLGERVVVTNFDRGSGFVLDARARVVSTYTYQGRGTSNILAAPSLGAVFLTEPDDGTVIRCTIPGGRCVTGPVVGQKPTAMTLVGDRLVVAVEGDKALAVVNARTLDLIGVARVPDTPRTLLSFRP